MKKIRNIMRALAVMSALILAFATDGERITPVLIICTAIIISYIAVDYKRFIEE